MTHTAGDANNDLSTRSQGLRKSRFPAQQVIPSDAFFDFTSSGHNIKISVANLLTALGVTGSIEQVGDAGDVPVLDDQGAVKGIRNINAGFGISASIDPNNSLEIATDFTFNEVGVPLVDDPDAAAAVFRSLVPGAGVNISGTPGEIQIALSAAPASTKTVIIAQKSDLPTPAVGVINLADDTHYLFVDDVDLTSDRINMSNSIITAADSGVIQLSYSGASAMLTDLGGTSNKLARIRISCPNAPVFNIDGLGTGVMQLLDMTVADCDSMGTWKGLLASQITNFALLNATTTGLLFTGSHGLFLSSGSFSFTAAGTLFDLGTATFDGFSFTSSFPSISAGATMLSGLTGSQNINAGGFATVQDVIMLGAGTALSGISPDDVQWQFALNSTIPDTRPDALISFNTPTATVIDFVNTPKLIAGVWTEELSSQFTVTAGGRATYNGVKDAVLPVSIGTTIEAVSGTNKDITLHLFLNGVIVTNANSPNRVSSGDPKNTSLMWQHNFQPGDFIEAFIENNTDAVNLQVNKASIRTN